MKSLTLQSGQFSPRKTITLVFVILMTFISGCSSKTVAPPVQEQSKVPKTSALVVFGIEVIEDYNNIKWNKKKRTGKSNPQIFQITSDTILAKLDKLKQADDYLTETSQISPLHTIKHIKLTLQSGEKPPQEIVRWMKTPISYETIAIHQIEPGEISLNDISYDFEKWEEVPGGGKYMYKTYRDIFEQNYGKWNIKPGEIVYLGHFTFYFKTKRYLFGIFTPTEINLNTKLTRLTISDQFDETVQMLQEKKPWLPTGRAVDISQPGSWDFPDLVIVEPSDVSTQKPQPPETNDSEEYFF